MPDDRLSIDLELAGDTSPGPSRSVLTPPGIISAVFARTLFKDFPLATVPLEGATQGELR